MFEQCDTDRNGVLNFNEFHRVTEKEVALTVYEQVRVLLAQQRDGVTADSAL